MPPSFHLTTVRTGKLQMDLVEFRACLRLQVTVSLRQLAETHFSLISNGNKVNMIIWSMGVCLCAAASPLKLWTHQWT